MRKKRIINTLLVIGLIGSCFIGYKIYMNVDCKNNIREEVVYKTSNCSSASNDTNEIKGNEAEEYKELAKSVLKRYFDIQDSELDEMIFKVSKVNEKIISDIQSDMKKNIQESYANNKISKEVYEEKMKYCNGGPNDQYEALKKDVKHSIIGVSWRNSEKSYDIYFNEKTNEVDKVSCFNFNEQGEKLNITNEDLKKTADKFITDKNLEDLENLNFEGVEESYEKAICGARSYFFKATYSYKNDNNKKIELEINLYSGKVQSVKHIF